VLTKKLSNFKFFNSMVFTYGRLIAGIVVPAEDANDFLAKAWKLNSSREGWRMTGRLF
jgi:hypothetical protein